MNGEESDGGDCASLSTPQYPYEALFRSVHFALMDNACREYLFVVDFFNLTSSAAQDFFDTILGKTLAYLLVSGATQYSLYYEQSSPPSPPPPPSSSFPGSTVPSLLPFSSSKQKHVESYVEGCYDAIGLFLCIHINYRFEAIMTRRGVPCLHE